MKASTTFSQLLICHVKKIGQWLCCFLYFILPSNSIDAQSLNVVSNITVVESAGTAVFTVNLSSAAAGTVTVNYTTSNGGASNPSDYLTTSGTLTFIAGETTKTVSVTIINDFLFEFTESFSFVISNATGANINNPSRSCSITNDDPQFSIAAASSNISESAGSQSYTVTLSAPQLYNASINYATSNLNALAGSDYVATSGLLNFAPGETTKVFTVPIINDYLNEIGSENFRVTISSPQNTDAGMPMSMSTVNADVSITNDDPTFSISAASSSISESAGSQLFTITLSSAQAYTASINYATTNLSAISGTDYVATSGTLSFAAGETTKVISVLILNDFLYEVGSENFRVTISAPLNSDVGLPMSIVNANADVSILNDDPQFSISAASTIIIESAGVQTYTVTLTAPQVYNSSVNYASSNLNAISGVDYVATSGTLLFAPGETTKVITVSILNDYINEVGSENYRVTISAPQNTDAGMPMSISNANADVSITNDDPTFSISAASSTILESAGTQLYTITLSSAQVYNSSIQYTTSNLSALAGTDYVATSGTLQFAPGETSKVIIVPIINDYIYEAGSQNFRFTISAAQNTDVSMPMSISTATADVGITNDDPLLSVASASYSVSELIGVQTYSITLSAVQSYNVSVNYATTNINAIAGNDYVSTTGSVNFAPGETTKVVLVPIINDYLFENSAEIFRFTISNAQNTDSLMPMSIGTGNADVSIADDDPRINISNAANITEAFTYQNFTVTMTAPQSYPVSVDYIAQGLTAVVGTDFTFSSCILTVQFAPGETTKNIAIRILDDAVAEPSQTYSVILSNARNTAVNMPMSLNTSSGTGNIIDNDGAGCGSNVLGVPVISGTTIYCPSTNLALSVAPVPGAIGYSWIGPNSFSASGNSISIANVSAIHSGVYTVKAYKSGSTICDSSVAVSVNVAVVPCASTVSLKLYIEGYYLDSGKMAAVLYNHGETDNATITDSVELALHNDTAPYALVTTQKVGLFTNGTILATFPSITGTYYVAVKHSSAVQTWSAIPLTLGPNPAVYDFTNSASQAFGSNLVMVDPGVFALYNGDINQDDNIDLLDASIMEEKISNFETCFLPTDLNGDGNTDLLDSPYLENNINLFVFSNHP
ncbi:MAG: hypothetical protein IPI46_01710 [Bacteroidetes bacterium]|nr:hypothetical protein [Bacteroidota bacterium]